MSWIDVNEAAQLLDVDPRQVRSLVAHGAIDGHKVGRVWLVAEDAVRERLRSAAGPGRPLSQEMSWLMLAALSRAGSARDPFAEVADDRRVRWRLRSSLHRAPPVTQWPGWLRRRAEPRRLWLHPAALERFAKDPRVVHPDPSERLGVQVADLVPFYVDAVDLAQLAADHHGRLDEGDLAVMAVAGKGVEVHWQNEVEEASLLDLIAAPHARVSAAARAELDLDRIALLAQAPGR